MYHIVICERSTGIVLELDFKTRFNSTENKKEYPRINFESIDIAELKALEIINYYNHLEVSIYSNDKEFIKRVVYE